MIHKTVLLNETIDLLKIKTNGVYVDLTLGGGGHSLKILENLEKGKLYGFDLDSEAIANFQEELKKSKSKAKVEVINDNFINFDEHVDKVDGIIADLGWSTDQLSHLEGLSYEKDEDPLDMRFDKTLGVKASDLLNALNRRELEKMFKDYADIYGKYNEQLVAEIIRHRESELFNSVGDLKQVIDKVFDREKNKNSYYSKAFQALRIAVNQELINLKTILAKGWEHLNKEGTFLVITFHSGEARIVEEFFTELVSEDKAQYLTKKFGEFFLTPSVEELRENMNSRSAKLFGIQKL